MAVGSGVRVCVGAGVGVGASVAFGARAAVGAAVGTGAGVAVGAAAAVGASGRVAVGCGGVGCGGVAVAAAVAAGTAVAVGLTAGATVAVETVRTSVSVGSPSPQAANVSNAPIKTTRPVNLNLVISSIAGLPTGPICKLFCLSPAIEKTNVGRMSAISVTGTRKRALRPSLSYKFWQEREDSNPRPLVLETSALPG